MPRAGRLPDGRVVDGKTPLIRWRSYQTGRVTEAEIRRWFDPQWPVNCAILTGALSGVVVVDLDSSQALEWAKVNLPTTPWFTRTRNGWHCFYRHPGSSVGNRARVKTSSGELKLDIRGDGGYVMAPGSVHKSGFVYRAVGNWKAPRTALPPFPDLLFTTPPVRPAVVRNAIGDVAERARAYLKRIPTPVEGCGSDRATYTAACRIVRGFALPPETAVDLLQEWAPSFDRWWILRKVQSALTNGKDAIGSLV